MEPNWNVRQFKDYQGNISERSAVVVVGSGAGGGSVAAELAEGGVDVIVLEEGGWWGTKDYTLDAGRMVQTLYRDAGTNQIMGKPNIAFAEGRCVGGSTVMNGGMCWRTPEKILDKWRLEAGLTDMSMANLEPLFARVETRYHVNQQDEESVGAGNKLFREGAARLGWYTPHNPRNQQHCPGTSLCVFGCPTGSKSTILQTYIPRALDNGARLFTHVRVDKVLHRGGKAIGVSGRVVDHMGQKFYRFTIHADRVIVACGASQTPALLHRSGIRHRNLGGNLQVHPNSKAFGVYNEDVMQWQGVHQAQQVHEFWEEGIVLATGGIPPSFVGMGAPEIGHESADLLQDFNKIIVTGALIEDSGRGRVRFLPGGNPLMTYNVNKYDFYRLRRSVALLAELHFAAGARAVATPFFRLPWLHSADEIPKIFSIKMKPSDAELMTVHIMGTTQMNADPAIGVCDSWGQVNGVDGLFVSDPSLFPSPIGVNPQETIIALSTRLAFHLLDQQGKKPTPEPGAAAKMGIVASRKLIHEGKKMLTGAAAHIVQTTL